jgi:hypothetical protein
VVTVTAVPEYETVGAAPIFAFVKITPVKIEVLFASKIAVNVPVFTALPVYVNDVFVVTDSIRYAPLAIDSCVSLTVIGVPTASPVVSVSATVTVLDEVLIVMPVIDDIKLAES